MNKDNPREKHYLRREVGEKQGKSELDPARHGT